MVRHFSIKVFGEARGSHGRAGWGAIVIDPEGHEQNLKSSFIGLASPIQAEYGAVIAGLQLASELSGPVIVFTCHEAVYRQLTGRSSARSPEVASSYVRALELLVGDSRVSLHLGPIDDLERAERLAAMAIDTRGRRVAID